MVKVIVQLNFMNKQLCVCDMCCTHAFEVLPLFAPYMSHSVTATWEAWLVLEWGVLWLLKAFILYSTHALHYVCIGSLFFLNPVSIKQWPSYILCFASDIPQQSIERRLFVFTQALDGFMLVISSDGRILYTSESISTYLGLRQVCTCTLLSSWLFRMY